MTGKGWRMIAGTVFMAAVVWGVSGCGLGGSANIVGGAASGETEKINVAEAADVLEATSEAATSVAEAASEPEPTGETETTDIAEPVGEPEKSEKPDPASGAEQPGGLELTDGADIRIMSFNILAARFGVSLDGRAEKAAAAIMAYRPDVVGLQEADEGWYDRLELLLGDTYEFLYKDNLQGGINLTTVIYNTETLSLVDSGVDIYTKGDSPIYRLMTWGVFETAESGRRFAVVDTHWDTNKHADYRFAQAEEMSSKVLALKEEYGCPVICTGDFNTNRLSGEFKQFLKQSRMKDAQANVENAMNGGYRSQHTICGMPDHGKTSIDHITYTDDADARFFMVILDPEVLDVSDHCPLITDFSLAEDE